MLQWKEGIDPKLVKYFSTGMSYGASAASLPKQMLSAHARLLAWLGRATPIKHPATNYPTDISNNVKVSIGNTAIDALAGIVRLIKTVKTEADLLKPFSMACSISSTNPAGRGR